MEGKRYTFLGSISNLLVSIAKTGSIDDRRVTVKSKDLAPEARAYVDKLLKRRDKFAKELLSSLNSGGSSAGMDLTVQIEKKPKEQQEQIQDESKEKSDGFEIAD